VGCAIRREVAAIDGSDGSRAWWFVAAAALALFGVLAFLIRIAPDNTVDRTLLEWVTQWDLPFIDGTMESMSWFTDLRPRLVLAVVGVVVIALTGHLRLAAATAIAAALTVIPVNALDLAGGIVADRIRPNGAPFQAFPSGHTLGTVVQYGFGIYLVLRLGLQRWISVPLVALLAVTILLVGPARIFTGAHWPSDVLGSYFLGTAFIIALVLLVEIAERWLSGRGLLGGTPSTTV